MKRFVTSITLAAASLVATAALAAAAIQVGGAELTPPTGWARVASQGWTRFQPADGTARLAFVVADKDVLPRTGQIPAQMDVAHVIWGDPKDEKVGNLLARIDKSRLCTTKKGKKCDLWHAVLKPDGKHTLILVYKVEGPAGEKHRAALKAAVASLRKL